MGLLDRIGGDSLIDLGMGLLSATGPSSKPVSLGQGLAAGLQNMRQGDEMRSMNQLRQMQQLQALQKMQEEAQQRQRMQAYRATLPEQDQGVFDLAPQDYIKNLPLFQKPQLVQIADPKEPLRNMNVWLKPGQVAEQGTVAGVGPMPEILDPRVQGAKRSIAAAGAARNNVILPPMESEEQKALGKDLAEQYSGIQKSGMTASGTLNNLNRMESLLKGMETGKLTPTAMQIAGLADSIGIKIDPKLGDKQAAAALANELALRAKNMGGENLMPGAMSDPDRRFLVEMVPSLANTPGGNQLILETMRRKARRDIDVSRMAREYRKKNKTLDGFSEELAAWSERNPLFSDMQPAKEQQEFKIIGVRP